ncbi:hypothetical protein F4679DRAFT_538810 [Xylaria curta]|nr:hypothetical protein F4679DRAFT_538810 [Xylaria curta]
MTNKRLKSFTWRISQIPEGTSKATLTEYFVPDDRKNVKVKSLCPDASELGKLTATLSFKPNSAQPDDPPVTLPTAPEDLEIDKDFEGLTPLYCPPKGKVIAADIIAITGLAGHAFGSWASSEDFMWLRDFASKFGPTCRVLTYGYDTRILGEDTSMTILADQAATFLDQVTLAREITNCDKRPIIFIGHSLGCLIIKKAMTNAHDEKFDLPVRGIIFMAAPHRGMNIEALQALVKGQPPETLVEELRSSSPTLQDLSKRFPSVLGKIRVLTVFETKKTPTVEKGPDNTWIRSGKAVMMVDAHSAKEFYENESAVNSHGNHSSTAKLARNSNTAVFNAVKGLVIKALQPQVPDESQNIEALDLAATPDRPIVRNSAPQEQESSEHEDEDEETQFRQVGNNRRPARSMGFGTRQSYSTNCLPQTAQSSSNYVPQTAQSSPNYGVGYAISGVIGGIAGATIRDFFRARCSGCHGSNLDGSFICMECPHFVYCVNCFQSKPHPHSLVLMKNGNRGKRENDC